MSEKIFGHEWQDVQKMQQKEYVPKLVNPHGTSKSQPTEADFKLLEIHGVDGLRSNGYFGVLDRLGIPFN